MFKRRSFQNGCLTREERRKGPDVWVFRFRETGSDGRRPLRKVLVGTVDEYRSRAAAEQAIAAIRLDINKEDRFGALRSMTVGQLAAHYEQKELQSEKSNKAYSTCEAYRCYLKNWISPRWDEYLLRDVKTVAVEDWLGMLKLARGSKAKIRNIMHALFSHAMRYEWIDKNPITLVRQSAKRERLPVILDLAEVRALLMQLELPQRVLVFLDAATGLRASELLALKWQDVDWDAMELNVTRSIVHQVVGPCKTEASRKPVPLDESLLEVLRLWQSATPYSQPEDWIFASAQMNGKQPLWPDSVMKRYIRPAAEQAGITKHIGWHTFRHTFSSVLKANGEDVKVVQELLRHANSRITLDTYTQAMTPAKREAQSKVVRMILPTPKAALGAANGR